MPGFIADLDDDMLHHLVETLTESGQAICLYDAEDRLRFGAVKLMPDRQSCRCASSKPVEINSAVPVASRQVAKA